MNISVSLATKQEYDRIVFARNLIKTNLEILSNYIQDPSTNDSIKEYLSNILDNYSFEDILSQMQNLEVWLDNIITVIKYFDSTE
jgi:hypothetical protein